MVPWNSISIPYFTLRSLTRVHGDSATFFLVVANFCYQVQDQVAKKFVVAKVYVHFYAAVVLGCVDDRITKNALNEQYKIWQ